MSRKLISAADIARQFDCHIATVWRKAKNDPHFPRPYRIGGITRWAQDEIDAYLSYHREAA